MKEKISITLDSKTLKTIETLIDSGKFRNRSHAVEYALKVLNEGN